MVLTDISDRKTPSTPIELTFGAQPVATGAKMTTLIAHLATTGSTAAPYSVYQVQNVGDPVKAKTEVDAIAGTGSEAGKMAAAFINANAVVNGRNFSAFRIVFLAHADTDFGSAGAALTAIQNLRNDFLVSPYDASSSSNRTALVTKAVFMSGIDRDMVGQFGTTAVIGTQVSEVTAAAINADSLNCLIVALPDTDGTASQTVGEVAAAMAGVMAQKAYPYLGLNGEIVGGLLPPTLASDLVSVGPTSQSELFLAAGITPLYLDAAGNIRIVRSVLTRVTIDGTTPATAYIDWQDVQVLYDFKEECYNVLQQSQFKNKKANAQLAALVQDEILRIAFGFETDGAFQNVKQSAKLFQVAVSTSSRGRFDFKIPVDVTPNLMVVAGNIQATYFTLA